MWNKNFVYILNYLKILKAVLKNNLRTHSLKQNKKAVLTTAAYFEVSTPSRKVAETIIALRLPSFTKNCVSGIKQKKWTPLNSAYSTCSRYQISAQTDNFNFLDQICPKRVFAVLNRKKWTESLNSAYSNQSRYQISA